MINFPNLIRLRKIASYYHMILPIYPKHLHLSGLSISCLLIIDKYYKINLGESWEKNYKVILYLRINWNVKVILYLEIEGILL